MVAGAIKDLVVPGAPMAAVVVAMAIAIPVVQLIRKTLVVLVLTAQSESSGPEHLARFPQPAQAISN